MWASPCTLLSAAWLQAHGIAADADVPVQDISNATAPRSCFRVATTPPLVLKQLASDADGSPSAARVALSKSLGLAREALFYKHLAPLLGALVPRVAYAEGSMETGVKHVFMEDLSDFVDSGALFGGGNPNNWNRDLASYEARGGNASPALVTSVTFKAYAQLHARFWGDATLLTHSFLRGHDWVAGEGRESWEASQKMASGMWASRSSELPVDPFIVAVMDRAVAGVSWESQLARLNRNTHFTLVHGDCWPGNVMWHRSGVVKIVDMEMVGLGSGPQELGQYMISNSTPAVRRECEARVVREYYDELLRCGVSADSFTWAQCWREYQIGGLERWLWFLCYFASSPSMHKMFAFFHDQVLAFMTDHKLTPDDITQPRA